MSELDLLKDREILHLRQIADLKADIANLSALLRTKEALLAECRAVLEQVLCHNPDELDDDFCGECTESIRALLARLPAPATPEVKP